MIYIPHAKFYHYAKHCGINKTLVEITRKQAIDLYQNVYNRPVNDRLNIMLHGEAINLLNGDMIFCLKS